ncbi:MAG: Asp-tRNA(Asn) amidotransferase subunit GatC [Methanobrevibacter sp.]|jgi:aspartyl-tRNA(Asn)/glutamyl-tRNA(Gln) amidotransferase subunit C|nr:Asp-tRNA(Asn) amidotransferase subunit GatC [Candidatus Methanoflexus mossambicus]
MKIEKDAEKILEEFSKTLDKVPVLEETHYIVDNVNLSRKDKIEETKPEKIMRNAKTDKDGNIIVKKADWVN